MVAFQNRVFLLRPESGWGLRRILTEINTICARSLALGLSRNFWGGGEGTLFSRKLAFFMRPESAWIGQKKRKKPLAKDLSS